MAKIYPGSKAAAGIAEMIISEMPPHGTYIELFLGAGAVARKKMPATHNIGVEADPKTIQLHWRGPRSLPGFDVIHGDAISFLKARLWTGDELVYLDPPYLMETRTNKRKLYRHEFATVPDHERLLDAVLAIPNAIPVPISHYRHPLYEARLAGWRTIQRELNVHNRGTRTEVLWMNFPRPFELHDYRFLAPNPDRPAWRERDRMKKKIRRWTRKLRRMDIVERYAVLAAIDGCRQEAPGTLAEGFMAAVARQEWEARYA